jgi:hypothetical protein
MFVPVKLVISLLLNSILLAERKWELCVLVFANYSVSQDTLPLMNGLRKCDIYG